MVNENDSQDNKLGQGPAINGSGQEDRDTLPKLFAVTFAEAQKFGCVYCGYRSGYPWVSGDGMAIWTCGECGRQNYLISEDLPQFPGWVGTDHGDVRPQLQRHPRYGIPAHGRPDKRSPQGEFFQSRGIGQDFCTCFGCPRVSDQREDHRILDNIAAYVQCKEAGERVVVMFGYGARLDFRQHEPDYVQVKVGACPEHLPNLEKLHDLTKADGIINAVRIAEARNFKK